MLSNAKIHHASFIFNLNQNEKLGLKFVHVDLYFVLNVLEMLILLALVSKQKIGNKKNQKEEEIFYGFGKTLKRAPIKVASIQLKRTWVVTI